LDDLFGQLLVLFVFATAASEAAVGFSTFYIVLSIFRIVIG